MSLPERKKSAEEIARMREQMGLPFAGAAQETPSPVQDLPAAEPRPVLPPKQVRSFKKSERLPVADATVRATALSESELPGRRRSEQELDELRRREALRAIAPGATSPIVQLQTMTAHWTLVALGYLLALAAAVDVPVRGHLNSIQSPLVRFQAMLGQDGGPRAIAYLQAFGFCAGALLTAAFIGWRKPRSRHHGGFIAVIAGLVLVFALLYYFPNLNPAHAS